MDEIGANSTSPVSILIWMSADAPMRMDCIFSFCNTIFHNRLFKRNCREHVFFLRIERRRTSTAFGRGPKKKASNLAACLLPCSCRTCHYPVLNRRIAKPSRQVQHEVLLDRSSVHHHHPPSCFQACRMPLSSTFLLRQEWDTVLACSHSVRTIQPLRYLLPIRLGADNPDQKGCTRRGFSRYRSRPNGKCSFRDGNSPSPAANQISIAESSMISDLMHASSSASVQIICPLGVRAEIRHFRITEFRPAPRDQSGQCHAGTFGGLPRRRGALITTAQPSTPTASEPTKNRPSAIDSR